MCVKTPDTLFNYIFAFPSARSSSFCFPGIWTVVITLCLRIILLDQWSNAKLVKIENSIFRYMSNFSWDCVFICFILVQDLIDHKLLWSVQSHSWRQSHLEAPAHTKKGKKLCCPQRILLSASFFQLFKNHLHLGWNLSHGNKEGNKKVNFVF